MRGSFTSMLEVSIITVIEQEENSEPFRFLSKAVISKIALEVIGKKLLNDNTFIKNVDLITKHISDAATDATHKVEISSVTYELLKKSIDKLKYLRSHDYNVTEDNTKKSED